MEGFLLEASIYFGAAILIVPLSIRFGLGSVLGYLLAGILIAPAMSVLGAETDDLQHFAEFGVVMMLFLIGLELDPRGLWGMRHRLIGLGGLQVGLTTLAIAVACIAAGLSWQIGLTLGLLLSLSSTAIVLQTLDEKHLMQTNGGRSSFSVLLAQDIAVIPMLAFIPLLATSAASTGDLHGAEGTAAPILSLVQSLPGWATTLLTLGTVGLIVLGGHYLQRPAFRFIHGTRLPEMSTFFSLFLVLGIGFLMMVVGLSPALGTFLAGVVLANSEFRHQIEADIAPFKGILLGLFFMTVGVGIDLQMIAAQPFLLIGLTVGLILIKLLVLLALTIPFHIHGRDRWLFALGLAQAGEFGFVVVSFALQQTILPGAVAEITLLVISLSMLLTPLLFIAYDRLSRRFADDAPGRSADEIDEQGPVIVAGIGRFGQVVNRLVRGSGLQTVVLDSDPTMIDTMRRFGVKGFFGDATRPELLEAAGIRKASLIVVAIDDGPKATLIVRLARQLNPDIRIIARAKDRIHVYELYQAGADNIVRETFDSAVRAGRYVLENMGSTDYEAATLSQTYYHVDRANLRSLAELWKPGLPVEKNAAYVERAKQLNNEMELALIQGLENERAVKKAAE